MSAEQKTNEEILLDRIYILVWKLLYILVYLCMQYVSDVS